MSLRARINKVADDARASYWFIPTVLVISAIVAANVTLFVDRNRDVVPIPSDWLDRFVSVDGARSVVSVVAQSMIGVTGVLFSMTMLAVSFAAGQFGPRLIGNFMRDRGNQFSLGVLIATFTFSLLILRAISNPHEDVVAFVPNISILVVIGLAITSVFVMIYHVHHVPETISVSNIIASLGRRFIADVESLAGNGTNDTVAGQGPNCDLTPLTTGYVHNVATSGLSELARERNWIIELLSEPGEFVYPAKPVFRIWGVSVLTDDDCVLLRQFVALGDAKTERQNLLFVAEQLIEIVGRAMSPGINDPFTAINCMQWLAAGLSVAVRRDTGLTFVTDDGVLRSSLSFERFLSRTLGDCLTYIQGDPLTRAEMHKLLAELVQHATGQNRAPINDLIIRLDTVT